MAGVSARQPRGERKENADKRRRQLLDAARGSILAYGLARTTLATVADGAGLSQGVAVFYFKSKAGLLTETLRDLYRGYEAHWQAALSDAGRDPRARLDAVIDADFAVVACGPDTLPLWFAFWGELHSQENYDDVAQEFEARRRAAMLDVWRAVLPGRPEDEVREIADLVETLTDGFWQHLHVSPDSMDRERARRATHRAVDRLLPGPAGEPAVRPTWRG